MARYKFINQIIVPSSGYVAHVKYEHGPYTEIMTFPTKKQKSFRVLIIGRQLGKGTQLTATVWVKMSECDGMPIRAINIATHKAPRILYYYAGSYTAQLWQKSGIVKAVAIGVARRLIAKWGKGWIRGNKWRARAEAEDWLDRALIVAGVPYKKTWTGKLIPNRKTVAE